MFSDLLVQCCFRNTKCLAGCGDTSSVLAELDLDEVTLELNNLVWKRGKRLWRSTRTHNLAVCQSEYEPTGDIAEFADVSRPIVSHELLHVCAGHDRRLTFIAHRRLKDKMLKQQRDVFSALTERREFDGDDV